MTSPSTPPEEDAAYWVARMDAADWTDDAERQLQAWLAGDARRRGALLQAQAAWLSLDRVTRQSLGPDHHLDRRVVLALGGSAVAAALVGGIGLLGRDQNYTTQIGEIRRVPLRDGSVATINTASDVEIAFADRRREVRLKRGEAWFQVAKDPARPFVVEAGAAFVQAVGTAFSVRRGEAGSEVLVTEGVVEIWATKGSGERVRIEAGQRGFVGNDLSVLRHDGKIATIDQKLAWRDGTIALVGERLEDAASEFNRYNRRRIVLIDPALNDEQFDGVFGTNDPEGFVRAVKESLHVPVSLDDPAEIRVGRES